MNLFLEIVSVVLSITFLVLLINNQRICWIFGILASFSSVILFYRLHLFSESILYVIYIFAGIYGWKQWSYEKAFKEWSYKKHLIGILITLLILPFWIWLIKTLKPNAEYLIFDGITTLFGLYATWLEIKKVPSSLLMWFFLNVASTILYTLNGATIYASLMVLFSIFSLYGFLKWNKSVKK